MKKEITIVVTASLFLLAYVLDYFAGPVRIAVKNQIAFLNPKVLSVYPLTAVAISVRSIAILFTALIFASLAKGKYFVKTVVFLFLGILAELYGIQQLATGLKTTSTQWTLSISYAGILLLPAIIYFLLRGIISGIGSKLSNKPDIQEEEMSAEEES